MAVNLTDLSGFGGDFAGSLAANLVCYSAEALGRVVLGDGEVALVSTALERSIRAAAERVTPAESATDAPLAQAVADSLNAILTAGSVRTALVEAATTGHGELDSLAL